MCCLTGYLDSIFLFLTCFINECYVSVCAYVFVCLSVSPWLKNLPVTAFDTLSRVGVIFEIKKKKKRDI